ncbi:MAG: preprotein translocase subunit YajC [Actinomycetia bacterium]|nr:preprotein translocase subunit YajC [Actinomycetes bacterium]
MQSSSYMLIIYVLAFIAIFYFMAIRPQQKQRRAHAALLASLKKGDSVVTAAGIYGKVKRVEDNLVVIEVAKGVNMKVARRAIAEIIRDSAQARAAAPEGAVGGRGKRGQAEIEDAAPEEIEEGGDEIEAEATEAAAEADDESVKSGS